eukprot:s2413_g20.t1
MTHPSLFGVRTAGPQPRAADRSGHCRTSSASSRSQWPLPDLNRELQIPVNTAGHQDPSGHCRTSTASSRSQWALPDLNGELQSSVGTAGPQLRVPDRGHCRTSTVSARSQWALPDLNGQRACQKECWVIAKKLSDPETERQRLLQRLAELRAAEDVEEEEEEERQDPRRRQPHTPGGWDLELGDEVRQCPLRSGAGEEEAAEEKEKKEKKKEKKEKKEKEKEDASSDKI